RPKQKDERQTRHHGAAGAHGDVTKYVQNRDRVGKGGQPIKHRINLRRPPHSARHLFAPLAANSRSECQIQNSTSPSYLLVVLVIPAFAKAPVEGGCECWDRTTRPLRAQAPELSRSAPFWNRGIP